MVPGLRLETILRTKAGEKIRPTNDTLNFLSRDLKAIYELERWVKSGEKRPLCKQSGLR